MSQKFFINTLFHPLAFSQYQLLLWDIYITLKRCVICLNFKQIEMTAKQTLNDEVKAIDSRLTRQAGDF